MNFKTKTMHTENLAIVKIYFRYGQSVTGQNFWRRIWNNNLGDYLLKKAKQSSINQANIFTAKSGYLNNGRIQYNISEIPSSENTVCLELIDDYNKLKNFLNENAEFLRATHLILINNHKFNYDSN
ncbi:hypothetical protein AR438_11495 [Chryseobacterium aquaticum]|uniref:Uncharacterized protein n=1 Tax=Chryseobacterium aquaticum TaxID=452084 RepID=A0A0Q3HTU4_9FLAO|nr:DUF190 domain-containing protein [Chryseobacterium aquaticum]KQK26191.1 hypothetical protein AR438_11495 [Chryseobacterium aquaticum]